MDRWRRLVLVVLALAVAYFAWRGVIRGLGNSEDLTYGYAAANAWLVGQNPYDAATLRAIVIAGGAPIVPVAIDHGVYFPTSLPLFLPIAFVEWAVAVPMGLALNTAAAIFIALALPRLAGFGMTSTAGLALTALILALGPIHTTLAFGQTAVVATAAVVGGALLEAGGRSRLAGLAYGLATAVKVQIALPFVAYLAWRRRWAALAAALVLLTVLTAVAVVRMELAGIAWLDAWLANLAWLTGPEGNGSPDPSNPDRFSLINLAYPLRSFLSETSTTLVVLLGVGAGGLAALWFLRSERARDTLLILSIASVLTLLVTYHRYYDAALLAIPLAWAFGALETPLRRHAIAMLVISMPFLLPSSQVALGEWTPLLPTWLTDTWLWQGFALAHQVWAILLMGIILVTAAAAMNRRDGTR